MSCPSRGDDYSRGAMERVQWLVMRRPVLIPAEGPADQVQYQSTASESSVTSRVSVAITLRNMRPGAQ